MTNARARSARNQVAGRNTRAHLVSLAMAGASAVRGRLADKLDIDAWPVRPCRTWLSYGRTLLCRDCTDSRLRGNPLLVLQRRGGNASCV